jgi:hypothetical protein
MRTFFAMVPIAVVSFAIAADDPKPMAKDDAKPMAKKYKAGDMTRPRPVVITPATTVGAPPSDAILLFNGKDLAHWKRTGKLKDGETDEVKWKVEDGVFEITPRVHGAIESREKFDNVQVHLEWATPAEVKGKGQGRGNSGFFLGGFGEVQILDSFENDTYPDGQAAALYSKWLPLVNASRKPGEWQCYDIIAHVPKLDEAGKVVKPGMITVLHNGVLAHHAVEFDRKFGAYAFQIQDHGNPIRFRNLWVRKLKGYDEPGLKSEK